MTLHILTLSFCRRRCSSCRSCQVKLLSSINRLRRDRCDDLTVSSVYVRHIIEGDPCSLILASNVLHHTLTIHRAMGIDCNAGIHRYVACRAKGLRTALRLRQNIL